MYSRTDLLRILHVTPRQLANWERNGLVTSAEAYSFSDLLEIKKVRDLCAMSVRPAVIRQSLDAMRKQASGVENPLLEAGAWSTAKHRVAFRHEGKLLEPIAGQFLMDFSEREKVLTSTPVPQVRAQSARERSASGLRAASRWKKIPTRRPRRLPPTTRCSKSNRRTPPRTSIWARSTTTGRISRSRRSITARRIEADPRYALAYFDLGNVLDETGRVQEAIQTYKTALQLAPTYADAHYNLALAYEKIREPRKALKHWQAYVKLDTSGRGRCTPAARSSASCRPTG